MLQLNNRAFDTRNVGRPADAPSRADVKRWLEFTENGHESYAASDFRRARGHYEDALKEAVQLFGEASQKGDNAHDALSMLLITGRNMADNLVHMGGFSEAVHVLKAIFGMLVDSIVNIDTPASLRDACLQNLEHSLSVLISHIRFRVSDDPDAWTLVKELTATARGVMTFASRLQTRSFVH